jgi:thioredoxin-like negative regulator of GroEL
VEQDPLSQAKRTAAAGSWSQALDQMLEILPESRDSVREAMVTVFAVMGEDEPTVNTYRRKLTAALF